MSTSIPRSGLGRQYSKNLERVRVLGHLLDQVVSVSLTLPTEHPTHLAFEVLVFGVSTRVPEFVLEFPHGFKFIIPPWTSRLGGGRTMVGEACQSIRDDSHHLVRSVISVQVGQLVSHMGLETLPIDSGWSIHRFRGVHTDVKAGQDRKVVRVQTLQDGPGCHQRPDTGRSHHHVECREDRIALLRKSHEGRRAVIGDEGIKSLMEVRERVGVSRLSWVQDRTLLVEVAEDDKVVGRFEAAGQSGLID